MSASIEPPPAPRHQCINAICGCNDLVSAGTCSEWCAVNTVEVVELQRGKDPVFRNCFCGHDVCVHDPVSRGTPERGMA